MPILLLTARDAIEERVAGLDAGADDYVVKPFDVSELAARVRALHAPQPPAGRAARVRRPRRSTPSAAPPAAAGRRVDLTRREAELLELMLRNARRVVTRELALEEVWGDVEAGANVVDRYVAYLRRKLGDPPLIHTVRGVGFRLDAP